MVTIDTTHLQYADLAQVRSVRVIGDFNDWDAPGQRLSRGLNGEGWKLDLNLEPGVYRYVFLENGRTVPVGEEFAAKVKVLVLTPSDFPAFPDRKGDGIITPSGVLHKSSPKYVAHVADHTFSLRLRTRKDDVLSEVVSVWTPGGEQKNYPMKLIGSDPLFDYYQALVVANPTKPIFYRFFLDDGEGARAYDLDGLSMGVLGGRPFQICPFPIKVPLGSIIAPPQGLPTQSR